MGAGVGLFIGQQVAPDFSRRRFGDALPDFEYGRDFIWR